MYLLGNAEQFSLAIAGNEVGDARDTRVVRIDAVRERFDRTGNARDPEWRVEQSRKQQLFIATQALAEHEINAVQIQDSDRLLVRNTRKRCLQSIEAQRGLENSRGVRRLLHRRTGNVRDEVFDHANHVVEISECDLCLDVVILHQVPRAPRFFTAETRAHVVHALKRVHGRFEIVADALGQEYVFLVDSDRHRRTIVVQRHRCEDGSIEFRELARLEPVAHFGQQEAAVFEDRHDLRVTKIQMTILQHVSGERRVERIEIRAGLRRNTERCFSDHTEPFNGDLSHLVRVRHDDATHFDRRLERDSLCELEDFRHYLTLLDNALHLAGRIDHIKEENAAAATPRFKPAL